MFRLREKKPNNIQGEHGVHTEDQPDSLNFVTKTKLSLNGISKFFIVLYGFKTRELAVFYKCLWSLKGKHSEKLIIHTKLQCVHLSFGKVELK